MIIGMDPSIAARTEGQRPDAPELALPRPAELPPATELTGRPLVAELEIDLEPVYVLDLSGNKPELPKIEIPNIALPASRAAQPDGERAHGAARG